MAVLNRRWFLKRKLLILLLLRETTATEIQKKILGEKSV